MLSNVEYYQGQITNLQTRIQTLVDEERSRQDLADFFTSLQSPESLNPYEQFSQALLNVETPKPERGSLTKTIENTLRYATTPLKISQMADRVIEAGFKTDREEAAAAVRSALKNLKKQKKVRTVGYGAYEHTNKKEEAPTSKSVGSL